MPSHIRGKEIEVVTREGECKLFITLELNININTGNVSVSATTSQPEVTNVKKEDEIMLPDFASSKVKFGKVIKD